MCRGRLGSRLPSPTGVRVQVLGPSAASSSVPSLTSIHPEQLRTVESRAHHDRGDTMSNHQAQYRIASQDAAASSQCAGQDVSVSQRIAQAGPGGQFDTQRNSSEEETTWRLRMVEMQLCVLRGEIRSEIKDATRQIGQAITAKVSETEGRYRRQLDALREEMTNKSAQSRNLVNFLEGLSGSSDEQETPKGQDTQPDSESPDIEELIARLSKCESGIVQEVNARRKADERIVECVDGVLKRQEQVMAQTVRNVEQQLSMMISVRMEELEARMVHEVQRRHGETADMMFAIIRAQNELGHVPCVLNVPEQVSLTDTIAHSNRSGEAQDLNKCEPEITKGSVSVDPVRAILSDA